MIREYSNLMLNAFKKMAPMLHEVYYCKKLLIECTVAEFFRDKLLEVVDN